MHLALPADFRHFLPGTVLVVLVSVAALSVHFGGARTSAGAGKGSETKTGAETGATGSPVTFRHRAVVMYLD